MASKSKTFSAEKTAALRSMFQMFDKDSSGFITLDELKQIMSKIGRDPEKAQAMMDSVDSIGGRNDGKISFEEFEEIMESTAGEDGESAGTGPDPKVLEFLQILEEYRLKCEDDGNYLEAGRAFDQYETLRKQEEKRQHKSLKAKQISERMDVQSAHSMQYEEFNKAWDKYMDEYDQMAQMYIQQLKEKHDVHLLEFQNKLHKEITEKPPKFSKELLEWRRRQQMLARQKNYAEAQKIKRIADVMEDKERSSQDDRSRELLTRKETKFRSQQQSEMQALLKRIDGRRKEHLKQRALDSKRLLQRNRNIQSVLESKQAVENTKQGALIKSTLNNKSRNK